MIKYIIAGALVVVIFVLIVIFFTLSKRREEERKTRTKAELEQENEELKTELAELTKKYDNLRLRRSLTERYGTGGEDSHD